MSATYDAFTIECDPRSDRYVAVLTHSARGGQFALSVCACARQAVASAHRGDPRRPRLFLGAFRMERGELIPYELTDACSVRGWTERFHNWTHAFALPSAGRP